MSRFYEPMTIGSFIANTSYHLLIRTAWMCVVELIRKKEGRTFLMSKHDYRTVKNVIHDSIIPPQELSFYARNHAEAMTRTRAMLRLNQHARNAKGSQLAPFPITGPGSSTAEPSPLRRMASRYSTSRISTILWCSTTSAYRADAPLSIPRPIAVHARCIKNLESGVLPALESKLTITERAPVAIKRICRSQAYRTSFLLFAASIASVI